MPRPKDNDARSRRAALLLFGAVCMWFSASCASRTQAPKPAAREEAPSLAKAVRALKPARWVALPGDTAPPVLHELADGTRQMVVRGMRVVERPDGTVSSSRDLLLSAERVEVLDLPERIGGGHLFVGHDDGETSLWRAGDFAARLRPLARLPFESAAVTAGLDRLYVRAAQSGMLVALEPNSGEVLGAGPLPEAPAYGALAFADPWLGAIETDIRGPLVTFDAGATWHPLGMLTQTPAITAGDGSIIVNTPRGRFSLDPTGTLMRLGYGHSGGPLPDALGLSDLAPATEDVVSDEEGDPRTGAPSPLKPLTDAVLYGVPIDGDRIWMTDGHAFETVDVSDARISLPEHRTIGRRPCAGTRLGRRPAFVCTSEGRTLIVGKGQNGEKAVLLGFSGPRVVSSSENGHLVVRGGCEANDVSGYCLIAPSLDMREVLVEGDVGVERVVALSDGRAAVIVPPRPRAPATLTLVDAQGKSQSRKLDLSRLTAEVRELVEGGLWLDGAVEAAPGRIGVWVAGGQKFVGIQLQVRDGRVTSGPLSAGLSRTSFAGSLALSVEPGGTVRETLDHGLTYNEVELPGRLAGSLRGGDPSDARASSAEGCSAAGCVLGDWVRVGWGEPNKGGLVEADSPDSTAASTPLFVSWGFECESTGRASRVVLNATPAPVREAGRARVRRRGRRVRVVPARVEELDSSAFRPFLGYAPPRIGGAPLAFDFGTEDQLIQVRGYTWGPRDTAWDRGGRWVVRGVDRFEVGPVWTTRVSRAPWPDALTAAGRFGSDPSHRSVTQWRALLDPSGDRGLLMVRASSDVELYTIADGAPIAAIEDPSGLLKLDHPTGVVVVNDVLYVGSTPSPREFRITKVERGRLELVGTYPRFGSSPAPRLVRGTAHNALGIVTQAAGYFGPRAGEGAWYLFPVDTRTGEALSPFSVARSDLGRAPEPCGPDDDGWLVVHTLSRSIARLELAGASDPIRTADVEARLIVREGHLCLSALATTLSDGDLEPTLRASKSSGEARRVGLVVTDHKTDRRFGFRCSG